MSACNGDCGCGSSGRVEFAGEASPKSLYKTRKIVAGDIVSVKEVDGNWWHELEVVTVPENYKGTWQMYSSHLNAILLFNKFCVIKQELS